MKLGKNIPESINAGDKLKFINWALWKYEHKIAQ